jgi:hypothetical protein
VIGSMYCPCCEKLRITWNTVGWRLSSAWNNKSGWVLLLDKSFPEWPSAQWIEQFFLYLEVSMIWKMRHWFMLSKAYPDSSIIWLIPAWMLGKVCTQVGCILYHAETNWSTYRTVIISFVSMLHFVYRINFSYHTLNRRSGEPEWDSICDNLT